MSHDLEQAPTADGTSASGEDVLDEDSLQAGLGEGSSGAPSSDELVAEVAVDVAEVAAQELHKRGFPGSAVAEVRTEAATAFRRTITEVLENMARRALLHT